MAAGLAGPRVRVARRLGRSHHRFVLGQRKAGELEREGVAAAGAHGSAPGYPRSGAGRPAPTGWIPCFRPCRFTPWRPRRRSAQLHRPEPPPASRVLRLHRRDRALHLAVPAVVLHQREQPAGHDQRRDRLAERLPDVRLTRLAAGGRLLGAVHPRLHHRPPPRAELEARGGDRDRGADGLRAHLLQRRGLREAGRAGQRDLVRDRLVPGLAAAAGIAISGFFRQLRGVGRKPPGV